MVGNIGAKSFQENVEAIFVENSARYDDLTRRVVESFPNAGVSYYEGSDLAGIAEAGSHAPKRTLILKRHLGRFIKPFPAHPWYTPGDTFNLILGFNCFASCLYCFVHEYFDDSLPTLFTNAEDMHAELREFLRENPNAWISTGEFMDSLQLDGVTRHTERIMETMGAFPDATLELRTKHSDVAHIPHCLNPRTLFSFSINPPIVSRELEAGSADLELRFQAARHLHEKGYRIALRVDPIVATAGYLESYGELADNVERFLGWPLVSRVFLGVLRFDGDMMKRFANGKASRRLLDAEYVVAPDGKYRLYKQARVAVYRDLADRIRRHHPEIKIDLVMEPDYVNKAVLKGG